MKAILLVALLAGGAAISIPDHATITADLLVEGRVVDSAQQTPVGGAVVRVINGTVRTVTQPDGGFRLNVPGTDIDGGWVRISVSAPGYQTHVQRVSSSTASVMLNVALVAEVRAQDSLAIMSQEKRSEVSASPPASADAVIGLGGQVNAPGRYRLGQSYRDDFNTESYAYIEESGFRDSRHDPLSTFSIDVDRASYSNVRRFLTQGHLPPHDAVRIEELINYFPYDYPQPNDSHPFSVTTEVGRAPWNAQHLLVRVGIKGREMDLTDRPRSNLVFLIDVSGSMQAPNKLPLLRASLRLLVDQLGEGDRVALVVYAGAAGLVLPSTAGDNKAAILSAIDGLEAGGSTAGGAGIELAYHVARKHFIDGGNNRVILATDGDFNVGASSDGEMIRLIEQKRDQGTFLTVLGFGTGNLKDSKMEQIADHGNGNFAYIDNMLEARKVLVEELGGTLFTIAKDVKIQVEFNPARVQSYRLIGYENRLLADRDFNDDKKDAGELGAGHTVTALYEVVPTGVSVDGRPTVDPLRYQTSIAERPALQGGEMLFVKLRYKDPVGTTSRLIEHPVTSVTDDPSQDFQFVAAVAGFGMLLRDSEFRQDLSWGQVIGLATAGRGRDEKGYRSEFVRLIETAQSLAQYDLARNR